MSESSSCPYYDTLNRVEQLRKEAFELTPTEQYRLAYFIAENIGHTLVTIKEVERQPFQIDETS